MAGKSIEERSEEQLLLRLRPFAPERIYAQRIVFHDIRHARHVVFGILDAQSFAEVHHSFAGRIEPDVLFPAHADVAVEQAFRHKTERCARMRFAVSVQEPVHELMGYGPAFAHFAVLQDRARLQIVFPLRLLATVCDQRRFGTKQLVELFGQSVHGRSGL